MASDLISSKKLIDAIKSMRVVFGDEDVFPDHVKNSVILAINLQPAVDAVEVVRCKDCMFFQPYEGEEHKGDCEELVGLESCVYEDDFCSYGRKLVKKDAVD